VRHLLRLFSPKPSRETQIHAINKRRSALAPCSDEELKSAGRSSRELIETIAVTAVVAARVLGFVMFDVQLHGALALAEDRIAEMQTGEGKTLAAVPAIVFRAQQGHGVHVMTANDYLARRDAEWMGPIYKFLGLSVGCIQQTMTPEQRRNAYGCDVTYATANEIGFDYLRDQLALYPDQQVHRPFSSAVIDEADSILIDEARHPLIIAGDAADETPLAYRVDRMARHFRRGVEFTVDEYGRNIALTDLGIAATERSFGCRNLFDEENLALLTAVQDSLHAHALLRRDVDYLVRNGAIESVDELKGRVVEDRRWPAGLHTAIEARENLVPKKQGRILGSISMQHLITLYPTICGMTGTAATQAEEFQQIYKLDVEVIPTNRPVIRIDHPDVVFKTRAEKEQTVLDEIRRVQTTGQPVLVGTASVQESERLSAQLPEIPHQILNARHDEEEAAIVARAGQRGAVTISTNMAGRGTDIRPGPGVAELGGLYVIGTNRHESRRIDNQLRGRAGRQGDPGCSRFFVSFEDDLMVRYGIDDPRLQRDPADIQRVIEGQHLELRRFLYRYESFLEDLRRSVRDQRQSILDGSEPCPSELERLVHLTTIDDLWSDYLAELTHIRAGLHWIELGGGDPFMDFVNKVHQLYEDLQAKIEEEVPSRLEKANAGGLDPSRRGATWTYLTTDQPFGSWMERVARGLVRMAKTRRFWG
jgi:preprotein translocase subunit SecA